MSLFETLTADIKTAMKAREKERLSTLRMVLSSLKNKRIDKGSELDEAEELELLTREAKRRRESIDAYTKANRQDLVDKEQAELVVIGAYLPQQLSPEEVEAIVAAAVAESGASAKKDIGNVMKLVMPKIQGRFPGKDVRPMVDKHLS
ncbi:MAG: aspartyl-tRNA amidotransferase [Deltaproteobacteria bacterium CG2_30_63_29]|nr:MAG: aspartyl-tRNA amidotransferase [Deltaproteobacteria bacterium CG2_30_63_29]PIV99301.1 MAG: aspartyl-tRNA amidotransferase [Deltaproteobacteria bacterium CG17_big_fil_post_rev_8_21_14_2_50_63_7]PJB37573.1 MAG: aspartyl-tRNA amidotransferase [Deltaproteobacteria bacterium CG_4_9_14_3_um_filter_63_12]